MPFLIGTLHYPAQVKAFALVFAFRRSEFGFATVAGDRRVTLSTNRVKGSVRVSPMRESRALRWGHNVFLLRPLRRSSTGFPYIFIKEICQKMVNFDHISSSNRTWLWHHPKTVHFAKYIIAVWNSLPQNIGVQLCCEVSDRSAPMAGLSRLPDRREPCSAHPRRRNAGESRLGG
jgi:hypothetical protein